MENISSKHEVKYMKRAEQRRLIGLARKGERLARIVKLETGDYAVGIHHNIGKPWRVVPVTNGSTTLKGAVKRFGHLMPGKTPPVRVFDESKLAEA